MPVAKISVTVDAEELRRARADLAERGLSLSAVISQLLREHNKERERQRAADELIATFKPEERATPAEMDALVELWSTPHRPPRRRRAKSAKRVKRLKR